MFWLFVLVFTHFQTAELSEKDIVEIYHNGVLAQERGNFDKAIEYFYKIQASENFVYPFVVSRIAQCFSLKGDIEKAIQTIVPLVNQNEGNKPWYLPALCLLVRWYAENKDLSKVSNLIDRITDDLVFTSWWIVPLLFEVGSILIKTDAYCEKGSELLQRVVNYQGYNPQRKNALLNLCVSPKYTDRVFAIRYLIRMGYLSEAWFLLKPELDSTVVNYIYAPNETEGWATFSLVLNDFLQVWISQRKNGYSITILEYVLRTLLYQNRFEEADKLLQMLEKDLPSDFDRGEYLYQAGKRAEKVDDVEKMSRYYSALIMNYPEHKLAGNAVFAMANWFYQSNSFDLAEKYFRIILQKYRDSTYFTRCVYFMGKMLETRGDINGAMEVYQKALDGNIGDYYAHRIAAKLISYADKDLPWSFSLAQPGIPVASIKPKVNKGKANEIILPIRWNHEQFLVEIQKDSPLRWLYNFAQMGAEEAEWIAYHICKLVDMGEKEIYDLVAVAHLGCAQTIWDYLSAKKNRNESINIKEAERLQIYFPLPYYSVVRQCAKDMDIDPFLIWSIMRQESTYRTQVISTAGARGLLQLIPSTAEWIKKKNKYLSERDPFLWKNPNENITFGCAYFRYLMDLYNNNIVYSLAGYNAGPRRVKEWRKQESKDTEEFIESIPFTETNNYVKKVLGNYGGYHSIYSFCLSER